MGSMSILINLLLYFMFQAYIIPKTAPPSKHIYAHRNVHQEYNAPSVAAPSEVSYLHPYAYPKSTVPSMYNYPASVPNDYASIPDSSQYQPLYEGHGYVYQGTEPTYARSIHRGETGSEMSYAAPIYGNPSGSVYSPVSHVGLNHNGNSQISKAPESVATYTAISKFNNKGQNKGVQMRKKGKENNSTWRRFSGRFSPGAMTDDRNYPQASNAPSKRLSHWFSSDGTGLKKFRAFRQPWARHN